MPRRVNVVVDDFITYDVTLAQKIVENLRACGKEVESFLDGTGHNSTAVYLAQEGYDLVLVARDLCSLDEVAMLTKILHCCSYEKSFLPERMAIFANHRYTAINPLLNGDRMKIFPSEADPAELIKFFD